METYVNFEMNANGALLAAYGPSRMYRSYFSSEEYEQFHPTAQVEEDRWSISFCIPSPSWNRSTVPWTCRL